MRTLLIDNHDSFTYNLFGLLAVVNGTEPLVVRNDEATWARLDREDFDNVVISPGPGHPGRASDLGVSAEAIRLSQRPVLGVCLGHQAIAHAYGGSVTTAPRPVHGQLAKVHHDGDELFAGVPTTFTAVRYHSWCVSALSRDLTPIAWSDDGILMALRHRERPVWGVQFHPESICSEGGDRLIANFRGLTERWSRAHPGPARRHVITTPAHAPTRPGGAGHRLSLRTRTVAGAPDAERAFSTLYGDAPTAFWLDSAAAAHPQARFSFMGDASGPLAETLTYDVGTGDLRITAEGRTTLRREPVLDHVERRLAERQLPEGDLGFGLGAGYVGFLGYELAADCGAVLGPQATTPDAGLIFADRVVVFDHHQGTVTLCALVEAGAEEAAETWLACTAARLEALPAGPPVRPEPTTPADAVEAVSLGYRHDQDAYRELIQRCLDDIRAGESYELCLTNTATTSVAGVEPLALYRALRRVNPAPFAAYVRLAGVAVLSSSPERFLAVDGPAVETRPIKGTRARVAEPAADERLADELAHCEKDLSENLMIVDLARNDLGRVCEPGSVAVADLFAVETFATVHQMVSTVRGRLREDRSPVDAVRAAFPPGSMTGAPKERSMQILERLEAGPRGPYAGALGYFGLGGGVDLSVVIRTLVVSGDTITFGVGGAVVALSDLEAELAEVRTKAEPLLAAIAAVRGSAVPAVG